MISAQKMAGINFFSVYNLKTKIYKTSPQTLTRRKTGKGGKNRVGPEGQVFMGERV